MLQQETKNDIKLVIRNIQVNNLKEFFEYIKTCLDSEGFLPQHYLDALLDVSHKNGINDDLLAQLEKEVNSLTSSKNEQV